MLRHHYIAAVLALVLLVPNTAVFAQNPEPQDQQEQAQLQKEEPKQEEGTKIPPPQNPEQVVRPSETASTPSTARKIITNFWSDQKAMWSSPFHMNRDTSKWWALFAGSTAVLVPMDKRLSNALPSRVTHSPYSRSVSRIGAVYTTLPIAGGLYLYGRKMNNAKAREVGVLGAEALLDSAIIVQVLKVAAGRERPELEGGRGRFFKGKNGFPSGHAMETWAFASLISHEYAPSKIVPIVTYSLATAVSISRFTGRKHYASDLVAGGAMGWFIGKYVFERHLDPNIHKRYDPNALTRFMPEINPVVVPSTRSYGVSLAWNR